MTLTVLPQTKPKSLRETMELAPKERDLNYGYVIGVNDDDEVILIPYGEVSPHEIAWLSAVATKWSIADG